METRARSMMKALTWQFTGLIAMAVLGFLITGSLGSAGLLSLSSCALGLVVYILHERIWQRVAWGWRPPQQSS